MLLACATASLKKINQDSYAFIHNLRLGVRGIAIADGIGSHYKAELGAAFATNKFKELIEGCKTIKDINLKKIFLTVQQELIQYAKAHEDLLFDELDLRASLGTTLLCLLQLEDEYLIAYVGNGAVLYFDGQFTQFGPEYIVPWNIVNLVNPHIVPKNGFPTLYNYVGLTEEQPVPTIFRLSRHHRPGGEIMAIMTDGIASAESALAGREPSGNSLWIKGEERLPVLYEKITALLKENAGAATDEDLQFTLEEYLRVITELGYMNDDATIGLLISDETISFHEQLYQQQLTATSQHVSD